MRCRQCGTDIADKALICYRCGTATAEPTFSAPPRADGGRPRRAPVLIVAILLLLALVILLASFH